MAGRRRSILALCLLSSAFVTGSAASGFETVNYSYDALGRLMKVGRSSGASSCYSYDEGANRSNVTVATSADCTAASGTPSLSVNDAVVTESATSSLLFLVSRSGSSASTSSVNYAVSNRTANTADYTASSGTLTFAAWQMTHNIDRRIEGVS